MDNLPPPSKARLGIFLILTLGNLFFFILHEDGINLLGFIFGVFYLLVMYKVREDYEKLKEKYEKD